MDGTGDEDLLCGVCSLVTPTTHTPCGKMFCQVCMTSAEFETHKKTCDSVVLACEEVGCPFSAPRKDVASHEITCKSARLLPIFDPLVQRISNLEKESQALQSLLKIDGLRSETGVSFVNFPLPANGARVSLFSGFRKLEVELATKENWVSFRIGFRRGPFSKIFPSSFNGLAILSLLSPNLEPFRVRTLDTTKNERFKVFSTTLSGTHGWGSFVEMEEAEQNLDGKKLWFSIKLVEAPEKKQKKLLVHREMY